jgi:hypothetical protein
MYNLIKCAKCGSEACYVEEVNQDIKTYFCYGCGFQTNSLIKKDSQFFEEQSKILPELYKDLFYTDEEGKIWMPSSVNLPQQGMIFANGPSKEDWGWAAVKAIPVLEEEKTKYPILGKQDEYYEWRMDMTTLKMFPERDYMDALSYINVLPE